MTTPADAAEALVAAQNAFADLPMPAAHGAFRDSTLADVAALHFDALARLLGNYARAVAPAPSTPNRSSSTRSTPSPAWPPRIPADVEAQLDRDFGAAPPDTFCVLTHADDPRDHRSHLHLPSSTVEVERP